MRAIRRATSKKWAKRIVHYCIVFCAAQYVIALLIGKFKINDMMFHPHEAAYTWQTPHVINLGDEEKPVAAYWLATPATSNVLLYSHGNGEDISDLPEVLQLISQTGLSVLAYDYPGYGLSGGTPTEKGCYETAESAYSFLTIQKKFKPENIIVLGRSLGTGPACYLAEKYPVKGLIFESGFLSAPRAVTRIRLLPFNPFPNSERIKNILCPKLFMHGTQDSVISIWHGKKMYVRSTGLKQYVWVNGAGHDDLISCLGEGNYKKAINNFMAIISYMPVD